MAGASSSSTSPCNCVSSSLPPGGAPLREADEGPGCEADEGPRFAADEGTRFKEDFFFAGDATFFECFDDCFDLVARSLSFPSSDFEIELENVVEPSSVAAWRSRSASSSSYSSSIDSVGSSPSAVSFRPAGTRAVRRLVSAAIAAERRGR